MKDLWNSSDLAAWEKARQRYTDVIQEQQVDGLAELDAWVRLELPRAIRARTPNHITLDDLTEVTRWKMKRGVWRARNLALVRGNNPAAVLEASTAALEAVPDLRGPIRELARLAGVGPATASAVVAAANPESYPFFDDLVAGQVPGLGKIAYTLTCYARYAEALRVRASELANGWTPAEVEQALWAHSGGKAGQSASRSD